MLQKLKNGLNAERCGLGAQERPVLQLTADTFISRFTLHFSLAIYNLTRGFPISGSKDQMFVRKLFRFLWTVIF